MVAVSSIMVLQKAWFPIDVFFTLSGVSLKLMVALSSRSMSHLLYRFRMIAFHPSTFCRLGLTPKAWIVVKPTLMINCRRQLLPLTTVHHEIKRRRQPSLWGLLYNILWYSRASYELRWYRLPARMPLGPRLLPRTGPRRGRCATSSDLLRS